MTQRFHAFVAIALTLNGCKLGSTTSATLTTPGSTSTPDQSATVHGTPTSAATANEILFAMGGSSSTFGNDGTMIASTGTDTVTDPVTSTDIIQPGGTIDPFAPDQTAFGLQGDPYVERCRQAGVPIPPAWGDTQWTRVKTITQGRIFALDPSLTTILYSYQDPNVKGTCAALPRMRGNTIVALGIICQSAAGQACFWDNKERQVSTDAQGRQFQATISDPARIRTDIIANGDNLIENCSSCHRGSNVFVLHHEDLQELPDSGAANTFTPIAQQGWNNPTLDETNIPNCASCHTAADGNALGRLDFDYCSTVMLPSIESTRLRWDAQAQQSIEEDIHAGKGAPMPPDGEDPADYAQDIAYIKAECKKAYDAAQQWWNWK